ncbi:hypothetical protein JKF63_01534 [Porcisia hertigi]|uniref:Uncharacterized protein n=1 Tax=Porcisia hertigi TaxID=2761500 RepID=A0A836HJY2_9TRYP|nr:hypothetical protein JKF63_01534 [Porcisia hertigi]
MRRGCSRLASALHLRTLLSPFGIGISKRIELVSNRHSIGALIANQNVPAGTPLLLAPDAALLTCQGALDADVNGLVPPPAEMIALLKDHTAQLDHVYLAYYLSLRIFTDTEGWFAGQIRRFSKDRRCCQANPANLRIWEKFARGSVTAPAPIFLAAMQYVSESSFRKPATKDVSSSASPPAALVVAPVVDVAVRSHSAANTTLRNTTVKGVKEAYLHGDIAGARQALSGKDGDNVYWVLIASEDISVGSEVSFSSHHSL